MKVTKRVTIQFSMPVNVEIYIDEASEDAILDAAWEDLRSNDARNAWRPDYQDMKEVVRGASILEEDIEKIKEGDGDLFIIAYQ